MMTNLDKKILIDPAVCLVEVVLPKLGTKATLTILDIFERKIYVQGTARTEKVFTLFNSNENMKDISKIIDSLEIHTN